MISELGQHRPDRPIGVTILTANIVFLASIFEVTIHFMLYFIFFGCNTQIVSVAHIIFEFFHNFINNQETTLSTNIIRNVFGRKKSNSQSMHCFDF